MPTRRAVLAAALGVAGAGVLGACSSGAAGGSTSATTPKPTRHHYGTDASQFGDLYRPTASDRGTVVLIHGGFWLAQYDLTLDAPLAEDLVDHGYTVLNLEYRRVGKGGGWPATLADVAAGIDLLATLDVNTSHVVAVGHSAGGQLAVWAAGRGRLAAGAPGADPKVALRAAVAQAGVVDLTRAALDGVGSGAVVDLIGGRPADVPDRYLIADPIKAVPLAVPVLCVHSRADANVPFAQSSAYVAAAKAAGASATLIESTGDHFAHIDPSSSAWASVVGALPGLLS